MVMALCSEFPLLLREEALSSRHRPAPQVTECIEMQLQLASALQAEAQSLKSLKSKS
jgi:hypothetical protein